MERSVIEINNKRLCAHCFTDLTNIKACFKCEEFIDARSLPLNTVVHGRYIIGSAIYYDNTYFGYYGYDPKAGKRVLVRELFPAGGFCKRVNKNISFGNQDISMIKEFNLAINNFHTESKLMSGIKNSEAVLKIIDLFDENGTSYCVSEFPENALMLSDYLKKSGEKLNANEALRIFEGLLTALDVVHRHGIIHGNIRPENVVLAGNKVLLAGANYGGYMYLENRSSPIYTSLNRFAPLEQLSKSDKRGPWTDIYSLGATLYFMLTGKYVKNIYERIEVLGDNVRPSAIAITPELPEKLIPVLERMLEPKTQDRFANIYELSATLKSLGVVKRKLNAPKASNKSSGSGKLIIILVSILASILLIGGAAFAMYYFDVFDRFLTPQIEESGTEETLDTQDSESNLFEDPTENEEGTEPGADAGYESEGESASENATDEPGMEEPTEDESSAPEAEGGDAGGAEQEYIPSSTVSNMPWGKNIISTSLRENSESVFGIDNIKKSQIKYIYFQDSFSGEIDSARDISDAGDGSVKAWIKSNALYIAAESGINAGNSCKDLFAGYTSLEKIYFGGCFHTDDVTDMSGMFRDCNYLNEVNFGGQNLITNKVKTMAGMFENCTALTGINFIYFNSAVSVVDMSKMFYGCSSILTIEMSNISTPSVVTFESMFNGCTQLEYLNIQKFTANDKTGVDNMFRDCCALTEIVVNDKIIQEAYEIQASVIVD